MTTFSSIFCFAQQKTVTQPKADGDSVIVEPVDGVCKGTVWIFTSVPKTAEIKEVLAVPIQQKNEEELLKIHGNIVYNFNYRSYIDTPFQQSGMMQHTVQTFMDGDIAGKYPFRAVFTYRGSNSPYFSNTSDISIQYRQSDMIEKLKSDLRKNADSSLDNGLLENPEKKYALQQLGKPDLSEGINSFTKGLHAIYDSLYTAYVQKRKALEQLEAVSGNRNLQQAIVEAREARLNNVQKLTADSIAKTKWVWPADDGVAEKHTSSSKAGKTDTTTQSSTNSVDPVEANIKKTQDSIAVLKKEVATTEGKILAFQKRLTDSIALTKRSINELNSPTAVTNYINTRDTTERSRLAPMQKMLLSVDQVGIGRSWINYSPLTVSNISLNGFNIEMNPGKYYVAAAIGSVNSQFRDFILNNNTSISQSVKLLRLGIGNRMSNNIILTMYTGEKSQLNTVGITDSAATQSIAGASIAATRSISKNTAVTFEYARSSYADTYDPTQLNKGLVGRVLNFNMHLNDAWEAGFKSVYPLTNTKIDGDYRKMGEAFQSFTIYATNVKQDAFLFHVNQLLWKKKFTVDLSVRKNDFNSPITAPGYSNASVFTTVQLSLALPRYPFVSIGYYPSSQLFTSNNIIYQSWYNTFNAISSYTYKAVKLNMSTNAAYTKFYNNQSDTAFSYYNAGSFSLTQSVYLSRFVLQANATLTDQALIHLVTLEPLVTYQYKNIITVTGSIKYSRLNHEQTLIGGTAGMGILINHIGTIQLHYDKVYLPAYNGNLMPVDMGRITFNKIF